MKYIIFGTGKYASVYSSILDEKNVICYVDNDINKQGTMFNGRKVFSPKNVNFNQADYIIIMISQYQGIIFQLINMGIQKEKIITYEQMGTVIKLPLCIQFGDKTINTSDWNPKRKSILLVTHELSRSGVPVAVMHMAELFIEMGFDVIIGSLRNGNLTFELQCKEIGYIERLGAFLSCNYLTCFINKFDCVLIGTLGAIKIADSMKPFSKPVFWWINEMHGNVLGLVRLPKHKPNFYYLADGYKTKKCFEKKYPDRIVNHLYYYLPDELTSNGAQKRHSDIVTFSLIAVQSRRKATDVFVDAISIIPPKDRKRMKFLIIGGGDTDYINEWMAIANQLSEINILGEVSQEELKHIYSKTDVLVCPSREDTVPIVVTQAFQNSIPCIVSDQVGQSMYMSDGYGGYVFKSEDVKKLARLMVHIANNHREIEEKGKQGRMIYEKYFSKQAVKQVILDEIISHLT